MGPVSLRLSHARGLTAHRAVIQDPRAASLPTMCGTKVTFRQKANAILLFRIPHPRRRWNNCRRAAPALHFKIFFSHAAALLIASPALSAGDAQELHSSAIPSAPANCQGLPVDNSNRKRTAASGYLGAKPLSGFSLRVRGANCVSFVP